MKNFLTLYWKESLGFMGSKLLIPSGNPQHGILLICQAPTAADLQILIEKQRDFLKNNRQNFKISDNDIFVSNETGSEPSFNSCYESNSLHAKTESEHCFRVALVATGFYSLYDQLLLHTSTTGQIRNMKANKNPNVAMLFTGQGSQYHGMARELYRTSHAFREGFDRASSLLTEQYGLKVQDVTYGNQGHMLDTSLYSQTSIFCLEIGMLSFWQSFGVAPTSVLGPSAGGFAAAVAAQAITLEEGARLVGGRAKLIDSLPVGGMTAVDGSEVKVQSLINQVVATSEGDEDELWLDIAVTNSQKDVVVAGRPASLQAFEDLCSTKGIKTTRLKAKQAFHSREIDSISNKYNEILQIMDNADSSENKTECKYISGIDGRVMTISKDFTPNYWQSHARAKVNLPAAVKSLWDQGARVFIEVGPRPVLIQDAKEILGTKKSSKALWIASMSKKDYESNFPSWTTILEGIGMLFEAGIINFNQIK